MQLVVVEVAVEVAPVGSEVVVVVAIDLSIPAVGEVEVLPLASVGMQRYQVEVTCKQVVWYLAWVVFWAQPDVIDVVHVCRPVAVPALES